MHKLSLQGLYVKILIEWVRDKERGAKREREDRKRVGRVCLFSVSKGAAFPKVPGATLQHLGSPRPFGCLLIANPHLCHMAR